MMRMYREGHHDGYALGILKGIDLAKHDLADLTVLPCHNYVGIAERALRQSEENHDD